MNTVTSMLFLLRPRRVFPTFVQRLQQSLSSPRRSHLRQRYPKGSHCALLITCNLRMQIQQCQTSYHLFPLRRMRYLHCLLLSMSCCSSGKLIWLPAAMILSKSKQSEKEQVRALSAKTSGSVLHAPRIFAKYVAATTFSTLPMR